VVFMTTMAASPLDISTFAVISRSITLVNKVGHSLRSAFQIN